ncbi:hypothetical protein MTO96_051430 [Rhipicephalus appendiculatus]
MLCSGKHCGVGAQLPLHHYILEQAKLLGYRLDLFEDGSSSTRETATTRWQVASLPRVITAAGRRALLWGTPAATHMLPCARVGHSRPDGGSLLEKSQVRSVCSF